MLAYATGPHDAAIVWKEAHGRVAIACLAIAIHVALILFLLRDHLSFTVPAPREVTLLLPVSAPPVPRKTGHAPPRAPRKIAPPPVISLIRRLNAPGAITPQQPQAIPSLNSQMFGCAPETLDALSQEQRAQCNGTAAIPQRNDTVDYADHTNRSRGAARWARDRARQNAPVLLPCASNQGIGVSIGTLICVGNGLINGFDVESMPSYADKPDTYKPPDTINPTKPRDPRD
jgi:hypothetical protein